MSAIVYFGRSRCKLLLVRDSRPLPTIINAAAAARKSLSPTWFASAPRYSSAPPTPIVGPSLRCGCPSHLSLRHPTLPRLIFSFVPLIRFKETETANRALELIDNGYSLAKYRAAADDPSFRVVPPVWPDLTINPDHYPPPDVDGKPARPKNGPRKKTRIMSNGEMNTSSRTYAIYNASVRAAGGVGILPSGGGGAGGGGGGGGASGVLDLSQGASQGAP